MIEHGTRKPDFAGSYSRCSPVRLLSTQRRAKPGCATAAKAPAKVPEFEVASIKPNTSGLGMMSFIFTPDGCSATNIPLDFLVSTHTEFHAT